MPRTYHAGSTGGVQPLVARQPELVVFVEAPAHPVASFSATHRGSPSAQFASQLAPQQVSLLGLLCPAADFSPSSRTDWPLVTDLAARLGCLPRVAALHLTALSRIAPQETVSLWAEERSHTAARNLLLAHVESELLSEFEAAGIRALPLKGISLARLVRNDPASRFALDIDFAIHPAHIAPAADILRAHGYRVSLPSVLLRHAGFLRSVAEKNAEITAAREHAGMELLVELHWKILPLPDQEIWDSLHTYAPAGVRTLGPEHYFLFLCEHLAGHGWSGVRWLCDIADFLLAFADRMDAERILRLARQAGLRGRVGITLELLHTYFGVAWDALDSLRDSRVRRVAARFLMRPLAGDAPQAPAAHHREQFHLQDSAARRIDYLWKLAHPTHVEWLRRSGNGVELRSAAAAWAFRMARLAGFNTAQGGR